MAAATMARERAVRLIAYTLIAVLGALLAFFVVMCALVRHVADIRAHPARFALELVLVSAGAAVPMVAISAMRRASMARLPLDTFLLVVKIAVAWVVLEISGVNTYFFPPRAVPVRS